jgi:hypothetical protein
MGVSYLNLYHQSLKSAQKQLSSDIYQSILDPSSPCKQKPGSPCSFRRYHLHARSDPPFNQHLESSISSFLNCKLALQQECNQNKKVTMLFDDFEEEDIKDEKKEQKEKK